MSNIADIFQATGAPATAASIADDLVNLGVRPGQTLLVHSSLSSIGWVSGGPVSVIDALRNVLGSDGTLVMPTHTSHLSDPLLSGSPDVPRHWVSTIRQTLPPFDPLVTPSNGMGVIPETFRTLPGVVRSNHPHDSFAAGGRHAQDIVTEHSLHDGLGERSPLAAMYRLGARILLLGVSHDSSTALHLAENRASFRGKHHVKNGGPVLRNGERQWVPIEHLDYQVGDFNRIGHAYATEVRDVSYGYIGRSQSLLMSMRGLVDYAIPWMEQNR